MRAFVLSLALLLALPAFAGGGAADARKQAESTMLVTGKIVIGTDGSVESHELDTTAQLTPALSGFIGKSLARWHFEPVKVDGNVVRARVPMSLRLVAKQSGVTEGSYDISIVNTYFGSGKTFAATDMVRVGRMSKPQYPQSVASIGGQGIVYLLVQIGRDGKVMNVDADRVNLRVVGTASQMMWMRKELADVSIRAVRRWTFIPPTTGEEAGKDSWLGYLPMDFSFKGSKGVQPGEWDTYIPGPRNTNMPWAREQLKVVSNPDALPGGGFYPLQEGAKLLTPPAT